MSLPDINYSQLSETEIALSDIFAKANPNGSMSRSSVTKLQTFLNTIGVSGYKGIVTPNVGGIPQMNGVDITENGNYIVSANGDYGTITGISITNKFVLLDVKSIETTAVYEKAEIPLDIPTSTELIDGGVESFSTGGAFILDEKRKILNDNIILNPGLENFFDDSDVDFSADSFINDSGVIGTSSNNNITGKLIFDTDTDVYFIPKESVNWYHNVYNSSDEIIATVKSDYVAKFDYTDASYCRMSVNKRNNTVKKVDLNFAESSKNFEFKNIIPFNLLDTNVGSFTPSEILSASGSFSSSNKYNTTGFILLNSLVGQKLVANYINETGTEEKTPFRFINFYTSSFGHISQSSPNSDEYTVEDITNAVYMRIGYEKAGYTGTSTDVVIYKEADYLNSLLYQVDGKISSFQTKLDTETKDRKAQLKPTGITPIQDYTINDTGYRNDSSIVTNSNYDSLEFVPKTDTPYYIKTYTGGGLPADLNYLTLLNNSDELISSDKVNLDYKGYTFDSDVAKVIVSYRNSFLPIILEQGIGSLENYSFSGDLAAETTTPFGLNNYVKKNIEISTYIQFDGAFDYLRFGKGRVSYYFSYVDVTTSQIKVTTSSVLDTPVFIESHGLSITDYLVATITVNELCRATITIITNGGEFTSSEFLFFGDTESFVKTGMVSTVYTATSVFKDLKKPVRLYADSYGSSYKNDRWTYHAIKSGADYFINNLSGGNSSQIYEQLIQDFRFGIPKFIIWALGMNDGADSNESTPNSNWKTYFDDLVEICALLDVELIGCTIPNVPSLYHGGKSKYVRDSGLRFIDFASVVDNGVDSDWLPNMLDADEIHPSVLGAIRLNQEALKIVPELYN